MTFDDYLTLPGTNWSSLKKLAISPLHYRWHKDHPDHTQTDAMVIGSATHKAVLEPDDFGSEYAVWAGARRAGKEWDAFQAEHSDKTILREQDLTRVWEISAAVRSHRDCAPYLSGDGINEATIEWQDPDTGIACKGRPDRLTDDGVLLDLKTARDLTPRVFAAQSARLGYHAQLAFYADGLRCLGFDVRKVAILAVESSPPYDCGVLVLEDDVLYAGREEYRALLGKLRGCLDADLWPGRYLCEEALELPEWARPDLDGDDDGADFDMEDM